MAKKTAEGRGVDRDKDSLWSAIASPSGELRSGYVVGKNVSQGYGNLRQEKLSALQSVRHFCLECQGGHYFPWRDSDGELVPPEKPYEAVKDCESKTCWLYPYRTGRGNRQKKLPQTRL